VRYFRDWRVDGDSAKKVGLHGTVDAVGSAPVVGPGEGQREEGEKAASGESGEGRGRFYTQRVGAWRVPYGLGATAGGEWR
jgi:hypothetical protein